MARLIISLYRPEDWTESEWKVQSDFQVDPAVMTQAMKHRWPDADIKLKRFPESPVEWAFSTSFTGWLLSDRQSVSITTGPKRSLIEFVLWYRAFVDSSIPLYLITESSEEPLELTVEISTDEIIDFVGY